MRSRNEDVGDVLLPSRNSLQIPDLRLDRCADYIDAKICRWGRLNRSKLRNAAFVHFYTDDRKFSHLWAHMEYLWNLKIVTMVEPNFSLSPVTPYAVAIWRTYQKRFIAKMAQDHGLKILVDLNVPAIFEELNLVGVPLGYNAFSMRAYNGNGEEELLRAWGVAQTVAGSKSPLFFVYGGGKDARLLSRSQGWVWCEEDSHAHEKRKTHGA
jgi:hypothetical protein